MHDLADFGHLRTPRIAEDLFSFDTSRPSRADRHPYHNDDISSRAAGMDEVSFMTDDSSYRSFQSTPALSEAELMSVLGPPSTNSSESKRLHNLRRAARTTPRVNQLLKGHLLMLITHLLQEGMVYKQVIDQRVCNASK